MTAINAFLSSGFKGYYRFFRSHELKFTCLGMGDEGAQDSIDAHAGIGLCQVVCADDACDVRSFERGE